MNRSNQRTGCDLCLSQIWSCSMTYKCDAVRIQDALKTSHRDSYVDSGVHVPDLERLPEGTPDEFLVKSERSGALQAFLSSRRRTSARVCRLALLCRDRTAALFRLSSSSRPVGNMQASRKTLHGRNMHSSESDHSPPNPATPVSRPIQRCFPYQNTNTLDADATRRHVRPTRQGIL